MITIQHASIAPSLPHLGTSSIPEERRIDPRRERRGIAILSQAGVERCQVALSDVSPSGCCVAVSGQWLRPGHFVTITLWGAPPLSAIVRWAHSGLAGLELLQELGCQEPEWVALMD